jgi:hypothetical protein
MRMSAASVFRGTCAAVALATAAASAPALADDGIPLAKVARDLGYHYAYLPLENMVSLTRGGSVITVRPGDAFFTVNDRREPVYGFVPVYSHNDVVVSSEFESEIRPLARKAAYDERQVRVAAQVAIPPPEPPDNGSVASVAAYYLRSADSVEVFGTATPGTHVSIVLRANLSEYLPVVTIDGADAVAGPDGSFQTQLNSSPDHFVFSRFFVEAKAPGDERPAIVTVRDGGNDHSAHTDADTASKH